MQKICRISDFLCYNINSNFLLHSSQFVEISSLGVLHAAVDAQVMK